MDGFEDVAATAEQLAAWCARQIPRYTADGAATLRRMIGDLVAVQQNAHMLGLGAADPGVLWMERTEQDAERAARCGCGSSLPFNGFGGAGTRAG